MKGIFIEPDQASASVEKTAIAEPEIEAPPIGGSAFASNFWEHEQRKAEAGVATGADGAHTVLTLAAYTQNVAVGTEGQVAADLEERVGDAASPAIERIAEDIGERFQEARRDLGTAEEITSRGNPRPADAAGQMRGQTAGSGGHAPTSSDGGPSTTAKKLPDAALAGEAIGAREINRLLTSLLGNKKQRFDYCDCSSGGEIGGPSGSPDARAASANMDFTPSFFARKSPQNG